MTISDILMVILMHKSRLQIPKENKGRRILNKESHRDLNESKTNTNFFTETKNSEKANDFLVQK